MTPETKVKKDILDWLNSLKNCKAILITVANEGGTPDIFCCYRGITVIIEVKAVGKSIGGRQGERRQLLRLREWRESGANVFTANALKQVQEFIGWLGVRI